MYPDIVPARDPATNRTIGHPGNPLFQVRPALNQCDMNLVQSLSTAGLAVAMADGSVRVISPRCDPSVYWSAVTPRGGESVVLE